MKGTAGETVYAPTRETVAVLRVANAGQQRPGDPGSGDRLYAVRFPDGSTGQASAGELRVRQSDGSLRGWREGVHWPSPLRTMKDVQAANEARGHSWFSPGAVRFFDGRVESPFYGLTVGQVQHDGRTVQVAGYFLHSRQFHGSDGSSRPRTFHVAAVAPDGTINPDGYEPCPFPDGYATLVEAQAALLVLLAPAEVQA